MLFESWLELFRSSLGIVLGLKSPTFIRSKVIQNDPSPLGSRVSPKTERGARGCVGGGGGVVGVVVGRITFWHFRPC